MTVNRHSIGFRISMAFTAIVVLLCAQGLLGLYSSQSVLRLMHHQNDHANLRLTALKQLGTRNVPEIRQLAVDIERLLDRVRADAPSVELQSDDDNERTYREIMALQANFQTTQAYELINGASQRQYDALEKELTEKVAQTYRRMIAMTLLVGLASVAIAFGWSAYLGRTIVQPVQEVEGYAHRIASGDLSMSIRVTRRDELGQLLRAINQMVDQLQEHRTTMDTLLAISQQLTGILHLDALLRQIVTLTTDAFGYRRVRIYLLDAGCHRLELRAGDRRDGEPMPAAGDAVLIADATSGLARAARLNEVVSLNAAGAPAEMAAPIVAGGAVLGVIDVQASGDALDQDDSDLLRTLANHIAIAIVNVRLFESVTQAKEAAEAAKGRIGAQNDELQRQAKSLQEARAQADAANRAKSEFLARMSHELRTPLNAILGHLQILARRPLEPEMQQRLSIIHHSGEHLLTLITDLLNFSKIEAGKLELAAMPFAFPSFLEAITDIMQARAEAKGLTVVLEATDLPSGVVADETRLREVLFNLLGNAVKFASAGPITLRVQRMPDEGAAQAGAGGAESARLRFEVQDIGAGIAAQDLERIFEPFEQAGERAQRQQGTGLGLSIARETVRLMGGELWVDSEVGRGSRFGFEVRLSVAHDMVAATRAERRITGYGGPRRSVLVVDDIASNRAVIADLLLPLGFEVAQAVDGKDGVRAALALRPDLVLMDIRMPVLDGLAAVRRLRSARDLAGLPVIAMSASVAMLDRDQTLKAGFDAFLSKPVMWPQLADTLEAFLDIEWEVAAAASAHEAQAAATARPPAAELEPLLELALLGDLSALAEETGRLEAQHAAYAPFTGQLRELAQRYEEQAVLALLKQAMTAGEQTL